MESRNSTGPGGADTLRRQVTLLWIVIVVFAFAFSGAVTWLAVTAPSAPDVVRVERLEVVEPDGSLSMVLANSQRPAVATLNRQVLMAGQEEERLGTPSITFFDGKGTEVGGLALGVREQSGSYRAMRHLSLDAHNQDQAVVLMHYQDPGGSTSGLSITDRPDHSLVDAFAELGVSAGASREQLQAALESLPEEGREARLQELFGTPRAFLGSARGEASLELRDGDGRPRIVIEVPDDGEPAIRILGEDGAILLRLPGE